MSIVLKNIGEKLYVRKFQQNKRKKDAIIIVFEIQYGYKESKRGNKEERTELFRMDIQGH